MVVVIITPGYSFWEMLRIHAASNWFSKCDMHNIDQFYAFWTKFGAVCNRHYVEDYRPKILCSSGDILTLST